MITDTGYGQERTVLENPSDSVTLEGCQLCACSCSCSCTCPLSECNNKSLTSRDATKAQAPYENTANSQLV